VHGTINNNKGVLHGQNKIVQQSLSSCIQSFVLNKYNPKPPNAKTVVAKSNDVVSLIIIIYYCYFIYNN
jgi:hypothetical protein